MGRPTWRFSLIALAAVIAWLLLIVVLSRVAGPEPIEPPPHAGPDTDPAPGVTSPPARLPDEVDGDGSSGSGVVEYLIPPMLILMGLVMLGTAIAARRQRRGGQPDAIADEYLSAPAARKATDSLARAAEIGLAEIGDLSREPREAIIACYAAMERELTRVPGAVPQDCDTPTEVLARAVDRHALPADGATELVELFEEARFSPHVMTEAHRDAAVRVLHRVLTELAERVPEVPA